MRVLAVLAVCVLLLSGCASGLKEDVEIVESERSHFVVEEFAHSNHGVVNLVIENFLLHVPRLDTRRERYRIAFVLERFDEGEEVSGEERMQVAADNGECLHEQGDLESAAVSRVVMPLPDHPNATWEMIEYPAIEISTPGFYNLYFSNCEEGSLTRFTYHLDEYNIDSNGERDYLSMGDTNLPALLFFMACAFGLLCVIWLNFLRKEWDQTKRIHTLMLCVVVLKTVDLTFESLKFRALKQTGELGFWEDMYLLVNLAKGLLLFFVIALLGLGWSTMRPFLTERDRTILIVVVTIQFMVNIANSVVEETAHGINGWMTWRDLFMILDMVCCFVLLYPIVSSLEVLNKNRTDGGASDDARNAARLQSFQRFYVIVIVYIYTTRIAILCLSFYLSYRNSWVPPMMTEVAAFVFYATTGYLFRPQKQNRYLPVQQDFVPYAQVALDDDDEDLESDQ